MIVIRVTNLWRSSGGNYYGTVIVDALCGDTTGDFAAIAVKCGFGRDGDKLFWPKDGREEQVANVVPSSDAGSAEDGDEDGARRVLRDDFRAEVCGLVAAEIAGGRVSS